MRFLIATLLCFSLSLIGQTIPIQVNRTTSVLASPLNAWSANAAGISTALGLGTAANHADTDFQFYDAELAAFAGLTSAADALPYFTGTATMATTPLSAFMRTVLDDVDAATVRATLGVGTGSGSVTDVSVVSANGVSGSVANSTTTPAITLTLGAITPSSINGNTITAGTGTLTLGSATLNAGLGGTLGSAAFTASTDYQASDTELTALAGLTSAADKLPYFTGSGTASLADLSSAARNVLDDASVSAMVDTLGGATSTGSGGLVRSTSPSLTTPTLGVASATTLNKLTITTPTTGSTLTVDDGKTLRSTATLTLSGTDSTVMTFPASSATIAGLSIAQTFSAANTFSANGALSAPAVSITGTPITGGTAATTQGLVKIGSGTSGGLNLNGSMLEVEAPSGFSGALGHFGVNGFSKVIITAAGDVSYSGGGYVLFQSSGLVSWNSDTFIGRQSAANVRLGGIDAAAPVAKTLSVQSVVAGSTNVNGSNFTIVGSKSTGTGTGGSIIFATSPAGSSGTSQNAAATALTIDSTKKATFAGPVVLPAGTTAAYTAPLKLTTQASPLATPEQGTFELVGNSLQFTQLVKRRGVQMSRDVRTSTTTVENTIDESAALITAEHGANYLEVGKCEVITLVGTIEQRSNPAAQITIRVKYAGSTIQTLTGPASAPIAANTPFHLTVYTTCRSIGGTGSMRINAHLEIIGNVVDSGAASTAVIDTTAAQNTTVTVQWGEANAANIINIDQGFVECIEPNK